MRGIEPDLLRNLLLMLDASQRSPPEPVLVVPSEITDQLGSDESDVRRALAILASLELIEGPGLYRDGWLFRQLTPRGRLMTEEVGTTRRWREIRKIYGDESPV